MTDKPHNPMLNGGAIMSCALIFNNIEPRSGPAEKYEFVYKSLHKLGGENISAVLQIIYNNAATYF